MLRRSKCAICATTIARDVRAAVLNAQIAFQRIGVTQELLNQANTAFELAQARYKVGLSGIVDLTQSQLAQTEALIGLTTRVTPIRSRSLSCAIKRASKTVIRCQQPGIRGIREIFATGGS